MDNFAIKTIHLTKKFNNLTAVKDLNLEIPAGEIFAFLGPNGAGKTTTVKLLSCLLKPTSGNIFICGYDASKDPIEIKKSIGLVPDHPFIYPKLKGIEFLQLIGNVYKVDLKQQKKFIYEYIEKLDLSDFIEELTETYSLGTRQKLIIMSALLHNPKVLLLDEPLVGLDPKSSRIIKNLFIELSKKNVTVFISTHFLSLAEELAHRIGIINRGELIAIGTKQELSALAKKEGTLEEVYLELTKEQELCSPSE
ncbi:MAG: ABC transporter ATP-binding protein [Endomicrobiia bacterium]